MNVLIVEDETMARKSLANTLARLYPELDIVGETGSVTETLEWLGNPANRADIIFMDVELSDGNCFEIFRRTDIKSKVIMTTAYDSYAVKAFEVESIDYLLKPIEESDLKRAVERCRARIAADGNTAPAQASSGTAAPQNHRHFKERFLVKLNDTIVPIKTEGIVCLYSEDKSTYLVTRDGRKYVMDFSLDIALEQLDPSVFFRISRNCIISMSSISSIVKIGSRLKIEPSIPASIDMMVSRSRTEDFIRWLEGR